MKTSESTALVDADFIIHIANINKWSIEKKRDTLNSIFCAMSIEASVHPLVLENELPSENFNVDALVDDDLIRKPSFDDFFGGDVNIKNYYDFAVRQLYATFTGSGELLNGKDIFSFWRRGESLGEVHSIALCISCGCCMFLSDDRDSKAIVLKAKEYCPDSFKVCNREDVMELLGEDKYIIFKNRSDRSSFTYTP